MSSTLSFVPRKVAKAAANRSTQPQPTRPNGSITKKNDEGGPSSTKIADETVEVHSANPIAPSTPLPKVTITTQAAQAQGVTKIKGKGKEKVRADELSTPKYADVDNAHLICLALSDYALWSDPDLRRTLDPSQLQSQGGGEGEESKQSGVYVPLSRVLERLTRSFGTQQHLNVRSTTTTIVKALRIYAAELMEVRLKLEEPSLPFGWRHSVKKDTSVSVAGGGYEVRRKDWTSEHFPSALSYSKRDWDERTIYAERIPIQFRSIPRILHFITSLLGEHPSPAFHPLTRIQAIRLPPHHQDKPGDPPTVKDFCLVTFATLDDVQYLLKQWPWSRRKKNDIPSATKSETKVGEEATDAGRFGFRTLTKRDWERRREEYLAYRTRLVCEIGEYEDVEAMPQGEHVLLEDKDEGESSEARFEAEQVKRKLAANAEPGLAADAPYPYGCLIFVRNVHPQTNKTTLRNLFSAILKPPSLLSPAPAPAPAPASAQDNKTQPAEGGLDYVDFNKGTDTCYLRLSTPTHADLLVSRFLGEPVVQMHGLDDKSSCDPTSSSKVEDGEGVKMQIKHKPIGLEKVLGRKEEVYWERVPEKVRRQAVQKAIALAGGSGGGDESDEAAQAQRRKKRRMK
ncbi:hypothetical protein AX17_006492 [Amanita inopinata Kibby_2008]|nr:hypothetical protein AX17_006492 [Amanita inopinata Kibby_2008]